MKPQDFHKQEEVLDFDELSGGVMSDFTLDYFFAQLLRYLDMKHINRANTSTQIQGMGIGGQSDFRLPVKSENSTGDFDLVTWLIILDSGMHTHP